MLDDVFHGIAEAAGGVHGDDDEGGVAISGIGEAFVDIGGEDGIYFGVEAEVEDGRGVGGVLVGGGATREEKERK